MRVRVCVWDWNDDITLYVQSRLWAKSGPAGLAARQINCWTLREAVGMGGGGRSEGGGVCRLSQMMTEVRSWNKGEIYIDDVSLLGAFCASKVKCCPKSPKHTDAGRGSIGLVCMNLH